jgi:ketosteroid isomerase-like protein
LTGAGFWLRRHKGFLEYQSNFAVHTKEFQSMKNSKLTQIALVATLLGMGAVSCAPAGNTNTTTTTTVTATPEPTPDTNAIVAEITRLENDWPRIIRERDSAAVARIEGDNIIMVYPDGSLGSEEQDIKDIADGNMTYDSWEISDMKVQVLDADAAIATLRIIVTNGKLKTNEGKTQNISGQYRAVDTFARRNGQWQLVASATVPLSPAVAAAASASPKASPAATASPATKASPAPKASPTRRPPPPPPAAAATP